MAISIANGIGIPFLSSRKGPALPQWFQGSCIYWFDVQKQGATNESLAANPVLKNFSNRKIYNIDFTSKEHEKWYKNPIGNVIAEPKKLIITGNVVVEQTNTTNYYPPRRFRVTNLKGASCLINYSFTNAEGTNSETLANITTDGIYAIRFSNMAKENLTQCRYRIRVSNFNPDNGPITIEALPIDLDFHLHGFDFKYSGIGGYSIDFSLLSQESNRAEVIREKNKVTFRNITANFTLIQGPGGWAENAKSRVKITGVPENGIIMFPYDTDEIEHNRITEDGIYDVILNRTSKNRCSIGSLGCIGATITIEELPQYPNALVTDGVNDYAINNNCPLLTDFTVIAKRKILNTEKQTAFLTKDGIRTPSAFAMESNTSVGNGVFSFGMFTRLSYEENDVTVMTPTLYNGVAIRKGTIDDVQSKIIFGSSRVDEQMLLGQYALYSLFLFDRTLTDEEITYVVRNLLNDYWAGFVLPPEDTDLSQASLTLPDIIRLMDTAPVIEGFNGTIDATTQNATVKTLKISYELCSQMAADTACTKAYERFLKKGWQCSPPPLLIFKIYEGNPNQPLD